MDSTDIRKKYDLERDVGAAANRLANYPPTWNDDWSSTGMECLLFVMRHIYCNSMMTSDLTGGLEWFPESEARNPILGHAWHIFGTEPAEVERSSKDRGKVNDALSGLGGYPFGSFATICDSTLMNETFWSQDMFCLSHHPVDPTTGHAIPLSADEIAELSKLVFKPEVRGACIQDVVNEAFGLREWKGRQMFMVPHEPCVVRVLYHADTNLCDTITIKQLKTLKLPVWDQVEGQETVCLHEVGNVNYFLMAVVNLRTNIDGRDRARAYTHYGQNVPCAYRPRSFIMNDWSVEQSGTYMLFYGILPEETGDIDVTDFPEVTEPREHGGTLDLIDIDMKEALAKVRAGEPITITTLPPTAIAPTPTEPQPLHPLQTSERGATSRPAVSRVIQGSKRPSKTTLPASKPRKVQKS